MLPIQSTFHNSSFPKDIVKEFTVKARAYSQILEKVQKSKAYDIPESSLFIAGDLSYQQEIKKKLAKFPRAQHVILVAIGGSLQGTNAVYKEMCIRDSLYSKDRIEKQNSLICPWCEIPSEGN